MKYLLALVGTLLCTSQSGFAISQYEIEQKPTQYQLAYSSDTEHMYVDLSSIHTKQTAANYKTVQARLLSLYTKNNVIADYDTNFTFYRQQPNATVTMTAWKISKPTFYAENGYPIDTLPQQRLAKDYGQHVAAPNSPSQRIGEFIYNTSKEMEKITYTYDNPYIPPQVFPPVVDQQTRTVLFGLMPPTDAVISTPMDRVIPAPPAPPTNMHKRVNSNHLIKIWLFQIDKDLLALKVLEITRIAIIIATMVIVTTAVVMAMVAEMVTMAVVKVLINYYLQKHLEIRKPSSLLMRVCFMAFTREIYFFSFTKNKATAPITGAIARVINADL